MFQGFLPLFLIYRNICLIDAFVGHTPALKLPLAQPFISSSRFPVSVALSSVSPNVNSPTSQTKLRRLKDRMWVRETLEDITAAEFACTIALSTSSITTSSQSSRKKKSRSVDFDNILGNLNKRIEDMCVAATVGEAKNLGVPCYHWDKSSTTNTHGAETDFCWMIRENVGMGSVTYTAQQRDALLE
jgi:hypothetical protein